MTTYHERMQSLYMHKGIDNDDIDTVRDLLEKNYPLNQPSLRGYLPLNQAVIGGHREIVRLLLEYGADPRVASTALLRAVQNNDPEIIRMLLEAGASPQAQDAAGKSALDAARELNLPDLVAVLEKAAPSHGT
jgi:uncharacterized protein